MTFKKIVKASIALCITAILVIAVSGCDDLGTYSDTNEYYSTFDDIVLIGGTSREENSYSVEDYFYNKDSRENFLRGEEGTYEGIEHSDYVYMAIPFESDIRMDSIALYIQSENDASVYINFFITDKIPSEWKSLSDLDAENNKTENENGGETEEKVYDDPDPQARIGDTTVHLKDGKWNSFVLDEFKIDGKIQKSVDIEDGQYVLLQIRNNSGVRAYNEEKQVYVDPQTGLELQKVEITMTNLLIRSLEFENNSEAQGG
jgi:hypothetical protein